MAVREKRLFRTGADEDLYGWPGGSQFRPARVLGPILRHLDATGILLEMVPDVSDGAQAPSGLEKRD
jgi:hypothetical protein